ncbi:MAG: ABC transporter ATP-binding protein [Planctomycetes bacterium]|nr:ABC transporter ATP-binding protein [Planctomycetota bacterium]
MIALESVTKRYGPLTAVDRVSFTLARDEIAGFVGPNGAGKSTVLKMLATYLYPTEGRLRGDGLDVVERPLEVRRKIGYLPGDTPLYHEMRTDRFLAFLAKAHGYRGSVLEERLRWVVDACGLEQALGKRIKESSTGYRKRIVLAAALVHDPEVILLDEPSHGLDPLQILVFRDLLRRLRPGRTILLSSHVISEVAQVCDRLLIIHNGELLADGPLDALCRAEGIDGIDLEELFLRLVRRRESDGGDGGRAAHAREAEDRAKTAHAPGAAEDDAKSPRARDGGDGGSSGARAPGAGERPETRQARTARGAETPEQAEEAGEAADAG